MHYLLLNYKYEKVVTRKKEITLPAPTLATALHTERSNKNISSGDVLSVPSGVYVVYLSLSILYT